ncbi:MAG: acyl-CoA dehydratase activase [Planctomycetota bacterium]|jgi:predicted CoA-substrate-specific enzyme activase
MITCGVDIGARTIDLVLLEEGEIRRSRVVDTGPNPRETAEETYLALLRDADVAPSDSIRTVATGYGRKHFQLAEGTLSEITCHAAGVNLLFPDVRNVVDIGGQDSKAIQVGSGGRVANFAMNDRCAAGTGKFIEMTAQTLQVSLAEAGKLALEAEESCEINTMCAVFAESEIIGLLHTGTPKGTILRGAFRSVAKRTLSLLGRLEGDGPMVFTGGVAFNPGVVRALEETTGRTVLVPENPQITGALGAALLAGRG